jgi:death on curing protein
MIYPNFEDVIFINREITDGAGTALYPDGKGKIESAIARMQSEYFGTNLYPSLFNKAAALIHSLVTTHPFEDANKRTGLITGLQFLYDNGLSEAHDVSDDDLADVIINLSSRKITQEDLSAWIEDKFGRNI